MIVYINKDRYIENLEERLYSLWREEQRLFRVGGAHGYKSAAGITSPAKNGIVTGSPSIQSILNSKFTNAADNPNVNPALKARLQFARDTYGSINDMKGSGVTATDLRTMTGQTDLLNNPINKNKSNIKSNSNNPVNNPTNNPINNPTKNSTDNPINNPTERSGHMNTMRQRYDRSMARRQRVEANNQNKNVFQQPLNNYVDPNTQAPKPPSNQSQNQGNPVDTKPPIVSTEQTQKATEITSVANNSADAAKTPAVKKMEEQQQQQQPPVEPIKPTEPVKPTEPEKPVETQQPGSGAGDTNGAATSQTATDTAATTTTNTNTTNTNEEKKKGMGLGGKIALGTAGTIGIGAIGYAMGSGSNKDDDKR